MAVANTNQYPTSPAGTNIAWWNDPNIPNGGSPDIWGGRIFQKINDYNKLYNQGQAKSNPTFIPQAPFGNPTVNSSQEDALRASYLNSLKPNYGFTFAGQSNPNSFSAVPGAKK
jgi:hypothetical protein